MLEVYAVLVVITGTAFLLSFIVELQAVNGMM
jgi:hypothetical protein